ncbi:MAG TPA: hypothetical protein VHM88_14955, partial [Candidatus Acidoferrales bacterium]|nr:hypothetical protein [Candidatus Acidoferrales bacterium]
RVPSKPPVVDPGGTAGAIAACGNVACCPAARLKLVGWLLQATTHNSAKAAKIIPHVRILTLRLDSELQAMSGSTFITRCLGNRFL